MHKKCEILGFLKNLESASKVQNFYISKKITKVFVFF